MSVILTVQSINQSDCFIIIIIIIIIYVPLAMKDICHFVKLQIYPIIAKGTKYVNTLWDDC